MKILIASLMLVAGSAAAGPDFQTPTPKTTKYAASFGTRDILPSDDVTFAFDSANLTEGARGQLDAIARYLKMRGDVHLVVEGYTDDVGSVDYNNDLATRRAQAVREALLERGIASDRLVLAIFGAAMADPGGNPLDRRAIVYATTTPVRQVVTMELDKRHATNAMWTQRNALFTEERGKAVARR